MSKMAAVTSVLLQQGVLSRSTPSGIDFTPRQSKKPWFLLDWFLRFIFKCSTKRRAQNLGDWIPGGDVCTREGITEDGVFISEAKPAGQQDPSEQICVIYLPGIGQTIRRSEWRNKAITEAKQYGHRVVTLDYPSYTADGITAAVVSQVNRLLQEGYKPGNICVHGHSFGGVIAARVGELAYNEQEPNKTVPINIVCDRAPKNISSALTHANFMKRRGRWHNFVKLVTRLFKKWVLKFIVGHDLDIDAAKAAASIPANRLVVLNVQGNPHGDGMIPSDVSLLKALEQGGKKHQGGAIQLTATGRPNSDAHNEELSRFEFFTADPQAISAERKNVLDVVQDAINGVSDAKHQSGNDKNDKLDAEDNRFQQEESVLCRV